jgi:superfamily II DNA or RNA helicase
MDYFMTNKEKSRIQKEIVESLPMPCHGLLNLAPRVGKTKITIDIIKREKPKRVLWVTPNAKLRDINIPKEFAEWKALTYLKKTDIICYASLGNHTGKYDMIILDEYQDLTLNNAEPLLNGNINYNTIIGLSGTHPKHKEKLDLYTTLDLDILLTMSIDEAVGKKLIAPYKITVIECRLDPRDKYIKGGSKSKPFMQTEESRYNYLTKNINSKLYSNQPVPQFYYLNRMRFIYGLKSKNTFAKEFIKKLKGSTLVFTGGIELAEKMCKHTFHSKSDDTDFKKFKSGEIDTLACVNSGGLGETYRDVDNFVIVQVNSNKKGDATQKIARSLVLQEGYIANIYILCVVNTVDEKWVEQVLESFNLERVERVSYKNYG